MIHTLFVHTIWFIYSNIFGIKPRKSLGKYLKTLIVKKKNFLFQCNMIISYNFDECKRTFPQYFHPNQGKLKLEMKLLHIVEKKPKSIIKLDPID